MAFLIDVASYFENFICADVNQTSNEHVYVNMILYV